MSRSSCHGLYTVAFSYSVEYNPPMNPKEFHSKSYEQQQEWRSAHAVTLNGWQTLQVPRPRDVVLARVRSIFGDDFCSIGYRMRLLVG